MSLMSYLLQRRAPAFMRTANRITLLSHQHRHHRHHSTQLADSSRPSLIIFDKDGTLISFHSAWTSWIERCASHIESMVKMKISGKIFEGVGYFQESKQVDEMGLLACSTIPQIKNKIAEVLRAEGIQLSEANSIIDNCLIKTEIENNFFLTVGDVGGLFAKLKEFGVKIAICTADNREVTLETLKVLNVTHLVDHIVCGDDIENVPKPNPENALNICSRLDVPPNRTIVVGDTLADIRMGNSAGCLSIGVLTGVGSKATLSKEAHLILDSIDDLMNLADPKSGSSDVDDRQSIRFRYHQQQNSLAFGQKRSYSTRTVSEEKRKDGGYRFIIIGGGSAGCVLANRLSADENNQVLLLEAGPADTGRWDDWKIHMPAALTHNLMDKRYNWYYETEPQDHLNNRKLYWPRGRVLGGSSSLNAMVYVRGHAFDYDRWVDEGAKGWSYSQVLPYFRKAETRAKGPDEYRGGDGPLHVSTGSSNNPLFQAFLEAGAEAGYPKTSDMNGYQQEGFGKMDMTIHQGKRWSTASAYLRPALKRPNLHTQVSALVHRLIFQGTRAIGVEFEQKGVMKKAFVDNGGDVILSGGAINSPQLLMCSGIGNGDQLKALDIPVISHLPGVGANLQDHMEVYVQYECTQPLTLFSATKSFAMAKIGIEWLLLKTGQGASSHLEAGAFFRSRAGVKHPDIQLHFLPSAVLDHGRVMPDRHSFQVHVGTMRPTSRGFIKLKSKDPRIAPSIEPNLLSTEEDRRDLRESVKLSIELFNQKAFENFRGKELRPGEDIRSDEDIDEFLRKYAESAYHPSCTCKMGNEQDPFAVVNAENGNVFGIDGLKVVDASIMPSVVSGNLNAPTIMMAEKMADAILGNEMLPPSNAPVYVPDNWMTSQR
eukprot:TRINITY_DN5860_c0_g1_i1.p1 TRINITY_DN5860_c0_g1~~TRINITY_DN5860_c0_g1_i1.p1  ORF type:complete len:882 (-),score=177.85 TRINITY_DN5860_c0_g1_i1:20-2665(-)